MGDNAAVAAYSATRAFRSDHSRAVDRDFGSGCDLGHSGTVGGGRGSCAAG